jgi:DNA modification methylase
MRWLVRLVTPPGGVVLDPFAGSGTTVEAAILEGFRCIAIEREADYLPLIEARIARNRTSRRPARRRRGAGPVRLRGARMTRCGTWRRHRRTHKQAVA